MKYILILATSLVLSACCSTSKDCGSCDKEKAEAHAAAAATTAAAPETAQEALTKALPREELTKLYTSNKKKLGKSCSSAASAYCGKVSRDLNVTEDELNCLYGKVFRNTREALPKLDGTDCAKLIKSFAGDSTKSH